MIARPASMIALLAALAAPLPAQADRGGGFLPRQDDQPCGRHLGRQRLRLPRPADRAPHGPPYPGRAHHRAAEHAGRRRHQGGELHGHDRPQGRHHRPHDHDQHDGVAGDAPAGHRVRHAPVSLDRQHHQHAQRGQLLAHLRHYQDRAGEDQGAGRRRPQGHRGRDLRHAPEQARRHEVQDRHRLSGRQRGQHRDGARRGARPRLELLGLVEVDQAAVDQRRRRFSSWRRSASSAMASLPTCRCSSSSPATTATAS